MPQMTEQERRLYSPASLRTMKVEQAIGLRQGLVARQKLAALGLDENELSEAELGDAFDVYTKVAAPGPRLADRSYADVEEAQLQRQFDTYLKLSHDPNEGLPVSRAFSASNLDGDTPAERELADAFDAYMGV